MLQLVDKLQLTDKIDNLQQVYGVFGCRERLLPVSSIAIGTDHISFYNYVNKAQPKEIQLQIKQIYLILEHTLK